MSDLRRIEGIEIFATGRWKGDAYTTDDLDLMVSAFEQVGFRPPVKLGHAEASGDPAYGWVERIYRRGEKLLADIVDVPRKVYDAIRARQYDTVSSEVYWNVDRGGRRWPRALKAIALLGAEIPAVAGLAPLRTVVNAIPRGSFQRLATYDFRLEDPPMPEDPGLELDRRTRDRMYTHRLDYETAFKEVCAHDRDLARRYAQSDGSPDRVDPADRPRVYAMHREQAGAGERIHALCIEAVDEGRAKTYGEALQLVLSEHEDLKLKYSGCRP